MIDALARSRAHRRVGVTGEVSQIQKLKLATPQYPSMNSTASTSRRVQGPVSSSFRLSDR
jgi:hypothetical protein